VDEEQLRQYIIHRLAEGVDHRDIILEVCQRRGLAWPQAEALVTEIDATATGDVARRRFPLFAFLALGIILAGVALIVNFFQVLLAPVGVARPGPGLRGLTEAGGLIGWLLLNLEFVGQIILGVAMVIGGAVGLHRVMQETLEA
jgi:hypothetical protein